MRHYFEPMHPLSIREATGDDEGIWLATLVLDFTEGSELVIGVPLAHGEEVIFAAGTRVLLDLPLPDGLRRYSAAVKRRSSESPPALHLSWPETAERIQRRDNVRVSTTCRVDARVIFPGGTRGPRMNALTTDLSAGGTRLALPEPVDPGAFLELVLHLQGVGDLHCEARVVRQGEIYRSESDYRFWAAMEFNRIDEPVRREITKYVFDVQREQMKKGLD